jgi:hypothetical protein
VWLDVLLKGKPEQQALARTEIAMILEARGHLDDAEEAYWTNVQARSTDRRAYERLIAIYRQKGDRLSESLVRRQLDELANGSGLRANAASPGRNTGEQHAAGPTRQAAPDSAIPSRQRHLEVSVDPDQLVALAAAPELAAIPEPSRPPAPPVVTATGPGAAAGHAYAAIIHAANRQVAGRPAATAPSASGTQPTEPGADAGPRTPAPSRSTAALAPPVPEPTRSPQASVLSRPQPVQPAYLPAPAAPFESPASPRRRTAPLAPHPEPFPSGRFTMSGLIALQPLTIGAFLLASIGAAAIIAFVLITAQRGFASRSSPAYASVPPPVQSAAGQLSPRCTDAALRFPALNLSDPRGSVAAGYREHGVDVDLQRPGAARLTADQSEQVLGGWMAISLLMERSGQPAPTLAGWLDADTDKPTLANAILAGRRVDGMVTPDEWATMRGWPASTCEGAFLHDSRNATAVRLMERVVAR